MYVYRTIFNLTACVNDFDAAYKYLIEDNMTEYLKEDARLSKKAKKSIESIKWILKNNMAGYIELQTNELLSESDLLTISKWVSGQNSDGLGEGFEQQDFASYIDEGLTGYEGDTWDDSYVMASFDWKTNKYIFELVSSYE